MNSWISMDLIRYGCLRGRCHTLATKLCSPKKAQTVKDGKSPRKKGTEHTVASGVGSKLIRN